MPEQTTATTAPLFIVGHPYSGTWLLKNILQQHPDAYVPTPETFILQALPQYRQLYPTLDGPTSGDARSAFAKLVYNLVLHGPKVFSTWNGKRFLLKDSIAESILAPTLEKMEQLAAANPTKPGHLTHILGVRALMDVLTAQAGKTRWIEKTPHHAFAAEHALTEMPDALVVNTVRDVRDFLSSAKLRSANNRTQGKRYIAWRQVVEWRAFVAVGERVEAKFPTRFYSHRYEDFVADGHEATKAMCDFAGLRWIPEMVDNVPWTGTAHLKENKLLSTERGVTQKATKRYLKTLTPAEIALCQQLCAPQMAHLGYEMVELSGAAKASVPFTLAGDALKLGQHLAGLAAKRGTGALLERLTGAVNRNVKKTI